MVETEYFIFTDSYHFIASPVDVLATSSGKLAKRENCCDIQLMSHNTEYFEG